jgi:D-alanyl-D-alanine dipeptidase
LKVSGVYILILSWFLAGCDLKTDQHTHVIKRRKVYVIEEKPDSSARILKKTVNADTSYIEYLFKGYDLVNIKALDSTIVVDLRYSDTNNFLKRNLYDGLRNAYFNCETALRICAAQYYLKQVNPKLSLVVLDASRPQHIQQMMWDSLKLHPDKKYFYLSPPEATSLHNYGCAVDATIIDLSTNTLLDMGTEYDFFGNLAEPIYEIHFLKNGGLSYTAYENRLLLRKVMQRAKMNPITSEWWHFSMCKKQEAIEKFKLIK